MYVGRMSRKDATQLAHRIEDLIACNGLPMGSLAAWAKELSDNLYDKVSSFGLLPARTSVNVLDFVDEYIASRTDWKKGTLINAEQVRRHVEELIGNVPLVRFTEYDAENYIRKLHGRLGTNTANKFARVTRQFFEAATKKRLITVNPFSDIKGLSAWHKTDKFRFISREASFRILDACPDVEWKLIFALVRFGGLRCPTEVIDLEWSSIDWEHERFTVNAHKTGTRVVPLFPEIRPYLDAAYDMAPDRAIHVISRWRSTETNLRTQLHRIIKRAGLKPWPKTFINLRSTRETELAEVYPLHVVCAWIGNSQPVAQRHYLQVTSDHFKKATQIPTRSVIAETISTVHQTYDKKLKTHVDVTKGHKRTTLHYSRQDLNNNKSKRENPRLLQ